MNHPEKTAKRTHYPGASKKLEILTKPGWLFLLLFTGFSFLLYFPVINRYFVSDDFKVLKRVCIDHIILIKMFFRPLSDLSIYMNYRQGGLEPIVFNSFNILIHGLNAFLLYRICFRFGRTWTTTQRVSFAGLASLFFLSYPFHNEAVVWLLGRGASMACLFALLGLVFFFEIKRPALRLFSVASCYFISLTAYESTIIFPFILVALVIREKEKFKTILVWCSSLIFTLAIHLMLRFIISGTLFGSYGEEFFESGWQRYLSNIAKVAGRLFLPPSGKSILLSILLILLIVLMLCYVSVNYLKIRNSFIGKDLILFLLLLAFACALPVISGISTQTSESDRMLYFPSVFLCMLGAYIPVFLIRNQKLKIIFVVFIFGYNIFFLEKNNQNWEKASLVTSSLMKILFSDSSNSKIFFINIPNEIEGAYVFRLGFKDALSLYGIDSAKAIPINYLERTASEKLSGKILPVYSGSKLFIPPAVSLIPDSSGKTLIYIHDQLKAVSRVTDKIYFWNKQTLESIPVSDQ